MKRREFIAWWSGCGPVVARGQSRSVARVGFLRQAGPDDKHFDAFRNGLRAAGYVEDSNMLF
jgi:hypothetical protein